MPSIKIARANGLKSATDTVVLPRLLSPFRHRELKQLSLHYRGNTAVTVSLSMTNLAELGRWSVCLDPATGEYTARCVPSCAHQHKTLSLDDIEWLRSWT